MNKPMERNRKHAVKGNIETNIRHPYEIQSCKLANYCIIMQNSHILVLYGACRSSVGGTLQGVDLLRESPLNTREISKIGKRYLRYKQKMHYFLIFSKKL